MQALVAIFAAFSSLSSSAAAQGVQAQPVSSTVQDSEGRVVVIPAGSPIHFAAFPPDDEVNATFGGRFPLTATYELRGHGEDALVRLWPDSKSQAALPYWDGPWGDPAELYLDNPWEFAQAVVTQDDLEKLRTDDEHIVRGQVSIIADSYNTLIECDHAYYSARFVSVLDLHVQVASNPPEEGGC